jgi:hypothetical protein
MNLRSMREDRLEAPIMTDKISDEEDTVSSSASNSSDGAVQI